MTSIMRNTPTLVAAACLALSLPGLPASAAASPELGRLFYTPPQRAKLETARAQKARSAVRATDAESAAALPLRYDGVLIRSDGKTVRWADGKTIDARTVQGLKPGQVRADGKVYEPYHVLPPAPPAPLEESSR